MAGALENVIFRTGTCRRTVIEELKPEKETGVSDPFHFLRIRIRLEKYFFF